MKILAFGKSNIKGATNRVCKHFSRLKHFAKAYFIKLQSPKNHCSKVQTCVWVSTYSIYSFTSLKRVLSISMLFLFTHNQDFKYELGSHLLISSQITDKCD